MTSRLFTRLTSRPNTPSTASLTLVSLLLGLLACALSLTPAHAQVNIERERAGVLKEGLHLSLDGSMSLIRGNVSLSQVGLMGKAQWVKGVHQPFVQASIAYGEREEVAFLDQSFGHARWTSMWHERAGSELFAQLQEDAFRSLVLRQLYGGGGRFVVGEWGAGSLAKQIARSSFQLKGGGWYKQGYEGASNQSSSSSSSSGGGE